MAIYMLKSNILAYFPT